MIYTTVLLTGISNSPSVPMLDLQDALMAASAISIFQLSITNELVAYCSLSNVTGDWQGAYRRPAGAPCRPPGHHHLQQGRCCARSDCAARVQDPSVHRLPGHKDLHTMPVPGLVAMSMYCLNVADLGADSYWFA